MRRGMHMGRVFAVVLGLMSASAAVVPSDFAFAQPSKADEAKDRFLKGVELYKEGDFSSALVEFKRSYELNPNYNVLNNIGQVYFQLKDYANALRTLQQFLTDGGPRVTKDKRDSVEKDIDKLKGRVATVFVTVNTPGATVYVDEVAMGSAPLKDAVIVNAGKRRFSAAKDGFTAARESMEFAGGDHSSVTLNLTPGSGAQTQPVTPVTPTPIQPTPQPQPQPPPSPSSPSFVGPIVAFSATGACAIVWATMGGLALSSDSKLRTMLSMRVTNSADLTAEANRAKIYSGVADGFMALTIVGAGIGTTLVIVAATGKSDRTAAPARVGVSLGVGNVGVSGTF